MKRIKHLKPKTKYLYIPIWLYSNATGAKLGAATGALYIPIWLYSNGDGVRPSDGMPFFTFQSGYIPIMFSNQLSTIPISLHSNLVIFQCVKAITGKSHFDALHSNLVIFQLYLTLIT